MKVYTVGKITKQINTNSVGVAKRGPIPSLTRQASFNSLTLAPAIDLQGPHVWIRKGAMERATPGSAMTTTWKLKDNNTLDGAEGGEGG